MLDLAAAAWIFWPVGDEPVKLMQRTDMCSARAAPDGLPWPERMLITPGGKPAFKNSLAA